MRLLFFYYMSASFQDHIPALQPIRYINTPQDLQESVQELSHQTSIAFDLEFDNNRYAYGVTLCVVQVISPDYCYVIDALAPIDLQPLFRLFEDEHIQKLVYAAGEDIRLLHSLECYPKNLYDVEIPAKLLNYEQTSMATILLEKFNYTLSKKLQKSNWLKRPLTEDQITYAADDVVWLHRLKTVLETDAEARGLMPFVLEEQAVLSTNIFKPEAKTSFLKQNDLRYLSPRDQHVLNELFLYRDDLAKKMRKPAYQVMDESVLRAIASGEMRPVDLLDESRFHRSLKQDRFIKEFSARLKEIQKQSHELSDEKPRREQLSQEQHRAMEIINRDKIKKFAPVQEVLAERFGTFAARYILSNVAVSNILNKTTTIATMKHRYRADLIKNIASELGIDMGDY